MNPECVEQKQTSPGPVNCLFPRIVSSAGALKHNRGENFKLSGAQDEHQKLTGKYSEFKISAWFSLFNTTIKTTY